VLFYPQTHLFIALLFLVLLWPPPIPANSIPVQSLFDAASSVQISILRPAFGQRSDATRLLNDLEDLTKISLWNLQELQFLIHPKRDRKSSNRSPKSETDETIRNQNIFSNLQKHTSAFQRLGDYIAGREDWSGLTPRTPRVPSVSPDSASRMQSTESSRVVLSVPPSPNQPYVEDVEDSDTDEDDKKAKANIEHVHYVPPKDDSPVTPVTEASKPHPRRVIPPQTPPQVVVRQATDPRQFESPKKRPDTSSSPLRASAGADDDSDDSDIDVRTGPAEAHLHPSALPNHVTKINKPPAKTLKDLEEEIARLRLDLRQLADSETSASDASRPELGRRKTSGKHKSVDLGNLDADSSDSRRPRASTTQGPERPKSFVEGSSYDPYRSEMPPPPRPDAPRRTSSTKKSRHLSRSPRTTPYSAVDQHSDTFWDYGYTQQAQSATDMYGPDPRSSLPTVLEGKSQDARTGRSGLSRSKRSSFLDVGSFEDPRDNFRDFFKQDVGDEADFPLFGPAGTQAPQPAQSRSRGNSRTAKDASPNSKPYISPRQLHESPPLEPDVREISVSLEDVFFGTMKKFKVRRNKYNAQTGIITEEERILEVPIHRGLKPGSKIKFDGLGHQTSEGTRELHFKLAEVRSPIIFLHPQKNADMIIYRNRTSSPASTTTTCNAPSNSPSSKPCVAGKKP
jgi:hypothetical protein